ncbi:hypothetical protein GIB67_027695 [Kingdonia uniflora]|uniref:RNase H type-1 domain-containing protein n=1 Tax=Kingdonia uniflora TaxID=39325 RepID=A0A7J7NL39_9MAGN|nr:hypothetical protein GIB67_027695 [Kingdonia uniflora]
MNHILPYDEIVQSKGITLASTCSHCFSAAETEDHMFFDCPTAKVLWCWASSTFSFSDISVHDGCKAILEMSKVLSSYLNDLWFTMAFSICRWLWNSREKIRFDETKMSIKEIQNNVLRDISNSTSLSKNNIHNTTFDLQGIKSLYVNCKFGKVPSIKSCMWILPDNNEVKLCYDGSSLGNPGSSGIGIIFYRDWEGRVLGTFFKSVGSTTNYLAEVQAIIDGVEKAVQRGWYKLWIVFYSYAAIQAFITNKILWKFRRKWMLLLSYIQSIRFSQT